MRLFSPLVLLPLLASVLAQERPAGGRPERFDYQSDVARLRKIVIESLYSHRDVFLRELISNANDAIEKYRVTSLQAGINDNAPLNITLALLPEEGGKLGRLVITDTGIGMSPEELTKNLGTLAKSGTSDFLAKAEADKSKGTEADPNLIGQFGLGFYSSFLVASDVYVASLPPPTKENPNPVQHVFASGSEDSSFDVYPDPRGNTLGRGTEITLVLKEDAEEYLQERKVRELVEKHSSFSTAYPIYLWATKTEEVPLVPGDEGYVDPIHEAGKAADATEKKVPSDSDDEGLIVEDAAEPVVDAQVEPLTKTVTSNVWDHLNSQPPLWMRDPKNITDQEYNEFYRATFKDSNNPIAWHHFKGDTGAGTTFRALIFIPPDMPKDFWASPNPLTDSVRLFVKRVFITNDLGEQALPKWISWLRAIIDADDLPLNVSRETLQSTRFMAQAKQVLIKRFIQMMQRIAAEDPVKYNKLMKAGYAPALKLGAIDSPKDQKKLMQGIKFTSTKRDLITLDDYLEERKKGQEQIFYLAGVGETAEKLAKSVFVERLTARGYEVLLLSDPMDEILFAQLKVWKEFKLQDVAKEGLKYGDEDEDAEDEKESWEALKVTFEPLVAYLKAQTNETVTDVILSTRLVSSPCAIVAGTLGWSGNMAKLMAAQNSKGSAQNQVVQEWAKKQRILEINPKSPLIQGLLTKSLQIKEAEDSGEPDTEGQEELKEVISIMIDGALVRSGFDVMDNNVFFDRVDRVLRRSLGVSEAAKADVKVKPAPPVVEPEVAEQAKSDRKLPDMDAEENLANILTEMPFDPSKAVDVPVGSFNSDHKVGVVGGEEIIPKDVSPEDWDEQNAQRLQDFLAAHDEL